MKSALWLRLFYSLVLVGFFVGYIAAASLSHSWLAYFFLMLGFCLYDLSKQVVIIRGLYRSKGGAR